MHPGNLLYPHQIYHYDHTITNEQSYPPFFAGKLRRRRGAFLAGREEGA